MRSAGLGENDNPNVTANAAPVLGFIGAKIIGDGVLLTFTVTATDPNPCDTRTFSLDAGAPPAATIHPTTGVFEWIPPITGFSSINAVTVRVIDNGLPALSAAQTFNITVISGPVMISVTRTGGAATLVWRSAPGKIYRLQRKHRVDDPAWFDVIPNRFQPRHRPTALLPGGFAESVTGTMQLSWGSRSSNAMES